MKTAAEFFTKVAIKHGNRYDYSLVEYKNITTKVKIVCSKHGIFEQSPTDHLGKKHGCNKCGEDAMAALQKIIAEQKFFKKAIEIHGEKYDYSAAKYSGSHEKIEIICPEHGVFSLSPSHHIHMKSGCTKCAGYNRKFYSESFFRKNPEAREIPAYLYVFTLTDESGEKFLKIGITRRSAANGRYRGYWKLNGVKELEKPLTLYEAFCLEQKILKENRTHRYYPVSPVIGKTECLQISLESILDRLR